MRNILCATLLLSAKGSIIASNLTIHNAKLSALDYGISWVAPYQCCSHVYTSFKRTPHAAIISVMPSLVMRHSPQEVQNTCYLKATHQTATPWWMIVMVILLLLKHLHHQTKQRSSLMSYRSGRTCTSNSTLIEEHHRSIITDMPTS